MTKKYAKSKAKPNTPGPGFRTPKEFRGKVFGSKKSQNRAGFNPASFKVQHKG